MRIVGCFLEFENKFVILLRQAHKPDGSTWCLPSGKVEPGEDDTDAMIRELEEETGYAAALSEVEKLGSFEFVSSSNQPYSFTSFRVRLQHAHVIRLEEAAHVEYKWVTAKECYAKSDLIPDLHELLRLVGYIK